MIAPKTAYETVRSPYWIVMAGTFVGSLIFAYALLFGAAFHKWLNPDYSHGFLVPLFSAYLVYRSWPEAPRKLRWPNLWGLAFLAVGGIIFTAFGILNLGKEWFQGLALVIDLSGVVLLCGGWSALRWAAPPIAFLIFMFPLPSSLENSLGGKLQVVAAAASTFVLQIAGYATYRDGVILHVKNYTLEVEKACSGLSMLLTFLALSTGMAMVVRRPWLDRILLLAAAIPVAIIANVIRIAVTGILYNEAGRELGDRVFHDFAGWMMMPIALAILWLGLKLFDWVFVPNLGRASREEVIRANAANANQSLLFMHAMPGGDGGKTAPAKPAATAGQNA